MITNPAKVYKGNVEQLFTYEGGSTLYHFCPYDHGLSSTFEFNIIFLANDDSHARSVLDRLLVFYLANCGPRRIRMFQDWLRATRSGEVSPTLAPTNQVYEVGWADNDTLLIN